MLVVAALGGNAMLRRGQAITADAQRHNVEGAARALARIVRAGHQLMITHGNGPQIGLLAMQADAWPLDLLGAQTDGMIGYVIEQALENALDHDRPIVTLLTQFIVMQMTPPFALRPSSWARSGREPKPKPSRGHGGGASPRTARKWRRVVPSPLPVAIPDTKVIKALLTLGAVVICGGGGGIPVIQHPDGALHGIEAVVDKDRASALMARQIRADALLLLTDVKAIFRDFGRAQASAIDRISATEAMRLALPDGSMRPKVEAAVDLVHAGGGPAAIGALEDALAVLQGQTGTRIVADAPPDA